MTGNLLCSGCGKEHKFRAVHSVQLVCRHCQQLLLKGQPSAAGKTMPTTREDMSVLRLGATGKWKNNSFEIIGRIQHFYQEGYRNLWYLLYQNGNSGWLGDWEGGYSLLTYQKSQHDFGLLAGKPGKQIKALGTQFEVRRISKHSISFCEGELPELALQRENFMAFELGNDQEQLILVHAYTNKDLEVFIGSFENMKDFSFNQLRPHHEWV